MTKTSRVAGLIASLSLVGVAGQAKDPQIKAGWAPEPVKLDGTADQWSGHLEPVPDVPALLGVQNDGDFLYVCFRTSDPKVKAQVTRVGMTFWVNGEGKDTRGYGVRFPVGVGFHRPRGEGTPATPPPNGQPAGQPGTPSVTSAASQIELIGPTDEDRFKVARADADPIQAALADDTGVMVIELRFPLKATLDHPLAVEPKAGGTIALGLETERPHFQRGPRGSGGGEEGAEGPPGGGGQPGGYGGSGSGGYGGSGSGGFGGMGRGGGRHGGMGRGIGGDRPDMPNPIKLWMHVTLAAPPATPPPTK